MPLRDKLRRAEPPFAASGPHILGRVELSSEVSDQLVEIARFLPELEGRLMTGVARESRFRFRVIFDFFAVKIWISECLSSLVNTGSVSLHREP